MNNLLSANFWRLKKSAAFWRCLAAALLCSAAAMLLNCKSAAEIMRASPGTVRTLDEYLFALMPTVGIFSALFTASFLGTEYSDGTLRTKLIAGHARGAIYLSHLAACLFAALLFTAALLLGGLAGLPVLGGWRGGAGQLASYTAVGVCAALAQAAILACAGMLSSRKSATMALCLLLFLVMLLLASYLYNALQEPELYSDMLLTVGGIEMGDPKPNPFYIGGVQRTLYQALLLFLPAGQLARLANLEAGPAPLYIAASLAEAAAATAAGMALFRRKDLK